MNAATVQLRLSHCLLPGRRYLSASTLRSVEFKDKESRRQHYLEMKRESVREMRVIRERFPTVQEAIRQKLEGKSDIPPIKPILESELAIPRVVELQVLSNGTTHMEPCVLIRSPTKTYFFNCPEGSTRLMNTLGLKSGEIYDFFITRALWKNFAGIPGLLLGMLEPNETAPLRLHGPKHIRALFEEQRPFYDTDISLRNNTRLRKVFTVKAEEYNYERGLYEDDALKVHYIPLVGQSSGVAAEATDIAYLVELKHTLRVDSLKLARLNIPFDMVDKLKAGEVVVLEDGQTIKPEDVMKDTSSELSKVLMVDIASDEKLECIKCSPQLKNFTLGGAETLKCIVHFTPAEVFNSTAYKQWVESFGDKCRHLVVNGTGPANQQIIPPYEQQKMLSTLDPLSFPELYPIECDSDAETASDSNLVSKNILMPSNVEVLMMRGFNTKYEQLFHEATFEQRIKNAPHVSKNIEQLHEHARNMVGNKPDEYPTIVFLGTTSASPTPFRGQPSCLLQLNSQTTVMVDCGEGTYGQMRVLFGPEKCDQTLMNLRAVFITRSHQDHAHGLQVLIEKRMEAFRRSGCAYVPLMIVSNKSIRERLRIFFNRFPSESHEKSVVFVDVWRYMPAHYTQTRMQTNNEDPAFRESDWLGGEEIDSSMHFPKSLFSPDQWNLAGVEAVIVCKRPLAHAFIFTEQKEGRRVVFSGDCPPSDELVKRGRNADILVHDCSLETLFDGEKIFTQSVCHCTVEQALSVAQRMRAKNVILSSISPRYSRIPNLPEDLLGCEDRLTIAMDNMVVRYDRLGLLAKLWPIYKDLFHREQMEMNSRISKKEVKHQAGKSYASLL